MTKRIIAMVLAVITALSILPSNIWAGNNTGIAATVRTATATVSDHAAMQGRTVRRNTYWDSVELSADPASAGSEFVQASVIPVELYMIVDAVYTRTSDGTVWYKVSAAPGHALPETLSSHPWIMQNFAGNPYGDPDALIAVYELCPDCGKENCKEDHTTQPTETTVPGETTQPTETTVPGETTEPTAPSAPVCDICGKENCTAQHVKCDFCGKYDCTEEHIVTVNGTFTDAAGKTQTLTVSAETFPEGTKVTAKQADVNAQLQSFGIPAAKKVFGLDISLQTAETSNYQPGEAVLVKVPVSAPVGTLIGILHTHDGKTTFMGVTKVQSDGTVAFTTDGFSEFAGFTVDFHYNNVDFSIDGMTSIKLSELFTAMGINEDASKATSVVFSDPTLVQVTQQTGDWLLTSLQAFQSNETLVITFSDGHVIVIDVTDAETASYTYNSGTTYSVPGSGDYVTIWVDQDILPVKVNLSGSGTTWWIDTDGCDPDKSHGSISKTAASKSTVATIDSNAPVGYKFAVRNGAFHGRAIIRVVEIVTFRYKEGNILTTPTTWPSNASGKRIGTWSIENTAAGTSGRTNTFTISGTTPVAPGYDFVNWSYTNWTNNEAKVGVGGSVSLDEDSISNSDYVDFTANWTPKSYTASFNSGGYGSNPSDKSFNTDSRLTLPTLSRPGYTYKWKATTVAGNWTKNSTYDGGSSIEAGKYGNVTFTAVWTANTNTSYTVKHYKQNAENDSYTEVTADRQTLTGTTDQKTNAAAKTYTGFTAQSFSQVAIAGDGSTVVSIYYNRNSYTVTVNKGTGISSVTGGGSYKYGASVTINATLNAGYKWKNWTGHSTQTAQSYTFTMPAANVTYTANAEAVEGSYTVKHYQQNVADNNYTEVTADRQTLTGIIGQNTNAAAKTYTGFTAQAFSQTTIAADGTTVVSIYYNRNSYTVTATAGTGIASVTGGGTYKYGASVTLKANLQTGYAWANWTGTATVATRDYTFTMPANNVSYQANATKENYSISYTLNGGSVATANVASYNVDTPGFTLTNPTKTAYDFVGWTGTGLSGATVTVTVPQGSTGNRSYTANWNPKNYTATFDANGGNVSTGSKSFNVEGALTLPDATKPGYSLVWEVTSGSGNWTVGDTYTGSVPAGKYGDVTFTAQWSPINYSISYNLNGGSVATVNKTSYNVETATFTLTNPTKAGYTFAGWTGTDLTGATVTVTVPQGSIGNRSYTATWTANTYTLTLDYNGGWEFSNANQTSVTKQVTYGTGNNASVSSLQPTRTGYRFVGWFTDPQGGSAVYDSQGNAVPGAYWDANGNWIGTDDMPLYAHWAEQYRYELTFDSNTDDAVTDMPAGMADTGWVDTADKTHTWAVVPVRVGYEFLGWSDDPNATTGAKVTSYTLTGVGAETVSQTLYAVWKAIDYNVTFVDHDGTVLKATVQYPFGTPAESIVRPADPVRAATAQYTYTFSGWDPTVSKVTGDVIYTATYKATLNRYTVTFEDGEGNVLKQETYDYGTKPEYIVTPADPEKEGDQQYTYIFTGWSPAIGQVTGDAVYTPVYLSVTNRYKVTFVDEDTTTVLKAETEYDYGTPAASIVQPATPTKTGDVQYGYTFVGWTPVLGDVVDHVTYIATYDRFVNKYKVTFLNHDDTVLSQKEYEYGTEGSAIELPTDPVKPEDDRFIYTFAGWSPSVQEVTGDVVYTPTYTTELRFPMVDLTITTTCANKDQSFVFTVVGKADDIAYGEVRLEVILVGDDSVTIRDLPVGDYTVTEKDGWSWRHTEKAQQSVRLDEAEELTFAFGGNDKLFWLSGWHANKRRKGGN